ncbi:protein kinase, partial [Streptomyces sp. MBT65]|uniref:serine/threonine-protein kinase n=1 Tax=Streptomyces sp. MBT65 TaxID=1488395 RepID=UPI0035B244A9
MTGRYRLVESIGQGGMGRVWRAADEMLHRQVAVKEMRIDGLDAEDTRTRRERTLREARATARIDHPNVVRVYDVVDEGERLWIVMELVAGRSLERILADDGALGPREVARIGLGLVAALRQVHAGGVLHRDIKPGNVLVESGGRRVVLTDFGIAAIQDAKALTMVGMLVGSPDYMAPERISGHPQGPPSDLWSLGATLCAALGGRSPFSRDTTLATLHAVLYEEPELPSSAGPLREVLAELLEKDPVVRPGLEEVEEVLTPVAFPVAGEEPEEPGSAERELAQEPVEPGSVEPESAEQPEAPEVPEAYRESPTPVFLEPSLVRAARDPRLYDPDPDPVEDAIPTQRPAVDPNSRPPIRRKAGVSLVRTEQAEHSDQAEPAAERAEQAERVAQAQLAEQVERVGPARIAEQIERVEQARLAERVERVVPAQLAEQAGRVEEAQPAEPAEPSGRAQPAEPAEALTERKPIPLPAHPPAPRPAPPHSDPGRSHTPRSASRRPALGPHPARLPRPE